jgi:hypothetical protein
MKKLFINIYIWPLILLAIFGCLYIYYQPKCVPCIDEPCPPCISKEQNVLQILLWIPIVFIILIFFFRLIVDKNFLRRDNTQKPKKSI